jgi:PadR family transcriptional regulator, regulatory protein PadR
MGANDRSLFPGALEMMILQTIRREPLHGYALARRLFRVIPRIFCRLKRDHCIRPLQRMLKAGWVAADWGVSRRSRKVRIYKITAAGRKQLERRVSSFEPMLEGIARVMKAVQSGPGNV